jgi:hypothetical protein
MRLRIFPMGAAGAQVLSASTVPVGNTENLVKRTHSTDPLKILWRNTVMKKMNMPGTRNP